MPKKGGDFGPTLELEVRLPTASDELVQVSEEHASAMYLPSEPLDEMGNPIATGALDGHEFFRGHSELREIMAKRVKTYGLCRPVASKKRIEERSSSN